MRFLITTIFIIYLTSICKCNLNLQITKSLEDENFNNKLPPDGARKDEISEIFLNRSTRFLGDYVVEDTRPLGQSSDEQNDQEFLNPYTYSNYRRYQPQHYDDENLGITYTREILIKQGRLKGFVKIMHHESDLNNVDKFLGIPYAEAPVGNRRFMPPGAPPQWNGLLVATKLAPVCPQNLPNLDNTNNQFSKGRYEQLKKLLPYLKIEKEDCLYLNLYVPSWGNLRQTPKFPVIVFIHGESYEWNSGNPYDGSILASYGQVIVVTLNYRLGVLGFIKPGINDHTVSNFGLFDQVAALQWVKDNIVAFGGDNLSVTLMGHGTGAACVNLLMVSPVAEGLFHRAILMSGSALSDWATTLHPFQATMQIANSLNCPFIDEEMAECLRKKRYTEILKAKPSIPQFSTPFGPVVDNLVVPNAPDKVMGQYNGVFSHYDLLFGVTELESYHILNAIALLYGLLENERDNLLRFYMQNRYEIRPDLALAATLREYTDIYMNPNKAVADEHRDTLLEILSDARVAAPLIQTGIYHAKVNPRSYMYVFAHNSESGEFAHLTQSIVGEELPFVFGAPLGKIGVFPTQYSEREKLLSEAVMKYWTNFAKTGNPKAPWKDQFLHMRPTDWQHYDIDWPEFNGKNQSYLNLGIPPVVGYQYRSKYMKFWNNDLPEQLNRSKTTKQFPPYPGLFSPTQEPPKRPTLNYPDGHLNVYPGSKHEKSTEDPYRVIKGLMTQDMYNFQAHHTTTENILLNDNIRTASSSDITQSILIVIVVLFFIATVILAMILVWKRMQGNRKLNRTYDDVTIDGTTDDDIKRSKLNETDDSFIMDIVRKSNGTNTYEPVKTSYSPINGYKLSRQNSTSTVDPHTKVVDWIAQEITKYSPKISKKLNFAATTKKFLSGKPKKVSIGIDATPQGRSNSVLRQEPIEITKAKSFDYPMECDIKICEESDFRRSSSTSTTQDALDGYQINHKHSHSDPVERYYHSSRDHEDITSFMGNRDINVTSRNEEDDIMPEPMTPEEALITIQRRNYPKVLPDFPEDEDVSMTIKRRSLPAQTFLSNNKNIDPNGLYKIPPAPPPRTTSTLGRRLSNRRMSNNITTSPLMLAEEPPDVQEPEITLNTLHVGPIIPKAEGIYSTVKRNKSLSGTTNSTFDSNDDEPIKNSPSPAPINLDKKNSFFAKLKPTGKVEPKVIIQPKLVKTPPKNPSSIPKVHIPLDETIKQKIPNNNKSENFERSPSNSSNDTECSMETVKPNNSK